MDSFSINGTDIEFKVQFSRELQRIPLMQMHNDLQAGKMSLNNTYCGKNKQDDRLKLNQGIFSFQSSLFGPPPPNILI